jgi:hypothetical protein
MTEINFDSQIAQHDMDNEKLKKHWGWVCKMNQASFIPDVTKYVMIKMLINEAFKYAKTKRPQDDHEKIREKYMMLKNFIDTDIHNNLSPTDILRKLSGLKLFVDTLEPNMYNSPVQQYSIQKRMIKLVETIKFFESTGKSDVVPDSEIET